MSPRVTVPRIVPPESASLTATPVESAAFEALMAPLGPFEPEPRIAVAVSGGSDSLALCLLADRWARVRGGTVHALTVDHRLRPESGAEARQVGRWLAAYGIAHSTLRWRGTRGRSRIQEEARGARLALLTGWCRRARVLHLLLGHQREDQAETALQRLVRGSGIDGLAAMAPVRLALEPAGGGVRLLRPLLPVPREALRATLARRGQPWIDDRSNRDMHHARPRLAHALAHLGAEGLSAARLARSASRAARDRAALDRLVGDLLATCAHPSSAGFVTLDPDALRRAPPALALRVLGCAVTTVSGAPHPPRLKRLERLADRVLGERGSAATLGGCRVVPRDGRLIVCREPAAAAEVRPLAPGESVLWDRRFVAALGRTAGPGPFVVRRLGLDGLARARALARDAGMSLRTDHIPAPARPALPALFDLDGPLSAPHLQFTRRVERDESGGAAAFTASFRPAHPLASGLPATLRVLPEQEESSDETIDRP